MNLTQTQRTRRMVDAAMIAAIYAALTYAAAGMGLAYGDVQFRFSEALTILPIFTPAAIPGLALGCLISNLGSPAGVIDWVFGTGATLLAAILTRAVRNIRFKSVPFLAPLPPVLVNAVVVGSVLAFTAVPEGFSFAAFFAFALSVGLGELAVCYLLGLPLAAALEKTGAAKKIFKNHF